MNENPDGKPDFLDVFDWLDSLGLVQGLWDLIVLLFQ